MSKRLKIIIGIGVVLLLTAMVIVNIKQSSGKTFPVQIEKVKRGRLVHLVSGTGKIQPELAVRISANVSARIIKMPINEGDHVSRGQILVELDRTRFAASVVQAQASLSSSQATSRQQLATMEQSSSEYDRKKKLFDRGLASQGDLESAETLFEVAKARYEASKDQVIQSEAYLEQAKDDLSKTTISSPINGVVTKLNKEQGEIALGSQFQEDVIMIVSDLSVMEAVVEIDENDVVNIAIGDSAKIMIDAFPDTVFVGKISKIAHSAKSRGLGTQEEVINFEVKVAVLNEINSVRPGMSANVDIIADTRERAIKIPIQAVAVRTVSEVKRALETKDGRTPRRRSSSNDGDSLKTDSEKTDEDDLQEIVFVVEDEVAKIRVVKTGIIGEKDIEILDGLKEGETVVIGSYRVLSKDLKHNSGVKVEKTRRFQTGNEKEE